MWKKLGFTESPYNTNPLKVCKEDVDLLVGRREKAIELGTALESSQQGILVLSGVPGVGKTSFLNVQQYLMESENALCGPKLLAARKLCPAQPDDTPKSLAQRALSSLYRSVTSYCIDMKISLPKQTEKIGKWITSKGNFGFSLGLNILGTGGNLGRQVQLPRVDDVTFEDLMDATEAITSDVVNKLGFSGSIIVIDNVENYSIENLGKILISFRDTFFSIERVWWLLIGQRGLGSLIQALDPRVFERMTGSGIEIRPISLAELHDAVDVRVERFRSRGNSRAPLSKAVHEGLFNASFGETRYVFDYANSICMQFIETTRTKIIKELTNASVAIAREQIENKLDSTLASLFAQHALPDKTAMSILRNIIENELEGLALEDKEVQLLKKVGELSVVRENDFKKFSTKTKREFAEKFLEKMWSKNLLIRNQCGKSFEYRLRGLAKNAFDFGLLER